MGFGTVIPKPHISCRVPPEWSPALSASGKTAGRNDGSNEDEVATLEEVCLLPASLENVAASLKILSPLSG